MKKIKPLDNFKKLSIEDNSLLKNIKGGEAAWPWPTVQLTFTEFETHSTMGKTYEDVDYNDFGGDHVHQ